MRTAMTEMLKDFESNQPTDAKQWWKEVMVEKGYGSADYLKDNTYWHQLLSYSLLEVPYDEDWLPYLSPWLSDGRWRNIFSEEQVLLINNIRKILKK